MLLSSLSDRPHSSDSGHLLALLCLGEIGRQVDLSAHEGLEEIIMGELLSPSEEIKVAASFSLGNIAVANHTKYLAFILEQIDRQEKLQYLLLHALKEVISERPAEEKTREGEGGGRRRVELRAEDVEKVLHLLFTHSESEEEGVRNVVAECLGKLSFLQPALLVHALKERAGSDSAFTRATVVMALKFAIADGPQPIDEFIAPCISVFLRIDDPDRHVRRAAILLLSTAAHNKRRLIEGLLPELLPKLFDQMRIKKEMIRTVDLGPFKHTVDDGLDIRKAAFDCIDSLLSTCLHCFDPSSFITPFLLSGLSDNYDVKMACHLILARLAERCGLAVLSVIDALVEPLEKTVTAKTKQDAVKQEVDRNEDMVKSALRAVDALSRISNVDSSTRFKGFYQTILRQQPIAFLYNQVRQEREANSAADSDPMDLA